MVVAGDFVRTGGMDAANHALASYLARAGRETHLVAHRVAPDLSALPGIHLHPVGRPLESHLLGFPLLDRAGRRAARALRGRGARVLGNGGNCRAAGAAWLHYVHAAYAPEIAGRPLRRAAERWGRRKALADERAVVRAARVVLANSALTRQDAVERLGAAPERVHTVYYGADAARFRPRTPGERAAARVGLRLPGDAPAVAFVGALGDRRKGFDTLFAAWTELCRRRSWDAVLIVVGAGGELDAWKTRGSGLGERVRFLGFRDDVPAVLSACDALVSPTRYEAYGLAVHEALCLGLPAVVSRAAGVSERIPASMEALLLDEPDDAGELVSRLLAWREGLEGYREAALALSDVLRAWTWDDMAARIVDIVEADG